MTTSTPEPSAEQRNSRIEILIAIVALLAGIGWFALTQGRPSVAQEATAPTATTEAWPTSEATFTPFPTSTAAPTVTPIVPATPIPLPAWETLNNYTVLRYTVQTVAEAQSPPDKLKSVFGTDRVSILVVGQAVVGIDLNKLKPEDITRKGNTITVRLPKPEVFDIVLMPEHSSIIGQGQRWAFSEYPGLETAAFERGKFQLEEQAKTDTAMLDMAGQLARLQMMEYLQGLGFTEVTVTVKQS